MTRHSKGRYQMSTSKLIGLTAIVCLCLSFVSITNGQHASVGIRGNSHDQNNNHINANNNKQQDKNLLALLTDIPQPTGECGANHLCQNGGTCVEGSNNYTCACPEGFTGSYCEHDINECHRRPHVCQNGATCINRPGSYQCICVNGWTGHDCSENVDDCSTAACESGATCHDRVGFFFCECPPGKIGLLCQLDDGCFTNPCHVNATCDTSPIDGRAICTCPSGFTGPNCSIDLDECAAGSPCEHGGSCVNTPGSFRCECPRGFTGSRCEININECENNPCMNDGTCLDEKGDFRCICRSGFTGKTCQLDIDECAQNPCENGAVCQNHINSFRCLCQPGYWGQHCEFSEKSSNCTADREGCELSDRNPWAACFRPLACWQAFKDGICNQDCNIPECLYDGDDCLPTMRYQPSTNSTGHCSNDRSLNDYCLKRYANGICDSECDSAECGWDGSDCDLEVTGTVAQGYLVIKVEPAIEINTKPENHSGTELAALLRDISLKTKTVLRVQNFRKVDDGRGTLIELIADNRKCQTSCYNSTELIARFLNALRDRSMLDPAGPLALKMTDWWSTTKIPELPSNQRTASMIYVIICGSLTAVCAVLMVVSNKQKVKEKAVTWFPEGFKPVLTPRNRDPTDRKPGRGVSTLQALGGNFFRGFKGNERNISTARNGMQSTEINRCGASTPNGGGIYHEPYDQYDQYGTYNGTDSNFMVNNIDESSTPTPMQMNPINMEGPHGLTPLMVASMGPPFSKEPLGLVAYGTTGEMTDNNVTDLLHRGAQLNLANNRTGETALHLAARCGRVDAARGLLERCDAQDVNAQDATGRTPLHTAIAADSLGVFELLIRCRGTDLNAQAHDGTTPLILATRIGTYSMLEELILNECEVTRSDANGKTALHWAAATNNVDAIRRLLAVRETNKDAQDLAEETPLFLAAREGAKGAVEILLSHNANKDISDQMDRSPIEIARSRQHNDIVRLLEDHDPSTPRSVGSVHQSSRQVSPFSSIADSNSNSSTAPPLPSYHKATNQYILRNNFASCCV